MALFTHRPRRLYPGRRSCPSSLGSPTPSQPPNEPSPHRQRHQNLALGHSSFAAYSSLAQRYQQVDHATKTWPELRQDIESLIHNNPRGTSREPHSLPRITTPRSSMQDWTNRRVPHSAPTDSRSARTAHDRYEDSHQYEDYGRSSYHNNEIRAATTSSIPAALQQPPR